MALKVTKNARTIADGSRPAVLYSSLQHAREWISGEVNLRLLQYLVDNYNKDAEVTNLVNTRELWFVIVANPDGYQYTFDHERLWRKNLRDNNGDNMISTGDGVDPNRNWPEHFKFDEEGLRPSPPARRTAGPARPRSRRPSPRGLIQTIQPEFHVSYHSLGEWLLTPRAGRRGAPDLDAPIHIALGGDGCQPGDAWVRPGPVGGRALRDER